MNNLEPIIDNNPYIQNLPQLVANYGLTGKFINRQDAYQPELNGLYFVVGTDTDYIQSDDITIDEIFDRNKREPNYFHLDFDATPVDENEPVARFMDVATFCQNAELMIHLWRNNNMPVPTKMLSEDLRLARVFYENGDKESYDQSLQQLMISAKVHLDPSNPDYKKQEPIIKGWYDQHQSRLKNWIRIHILNKKNKISLDALSERATAGVFKLVVRTRLVAHALEHELKKHPEILYHRDKMRGQKYIFPQNEGFAVIGQDNDMRFSNFYFDMNFANEVEKIINDLAFDDAIEKTPDEIARKHGGVIMVTLPQTEYVDFTEMLNQNHIDWCFNVGNKAYWDCRQMFVLPISAQELVSSYLQERCIKIANEHVLRPEDITAPQIPLFQQLNTQPVNPISHSTERWMPTPTNRQPTTHKNQHENSEPAIWTPTPTQHIMSQPLLPNDDDDKCK